MKIFNLDSPLMVFLSKVANLMVLNILTIICCIPIVTAGAAITALYYVTIKMARGDDPYIIKGYFKSFKENFRQATIIWLIMLVVIGILYVDYRVIFQMMNGGLASFMKVVIVIVIFLLLLTGLYIFPVLSRFENTIKNTFQNAFFMSVTNLPKSILIILIHLFPAVAVMATYQAVPFIFLLGIPAVAYFCSLLYVSIFKKYEPAEEVTDSDELAPLSFIAEEEKEKAEAAKAPSGEEK